MVEAARDARERLIDSLRRLSDDELVARLKGLAARERRATALLVAHLAELDTRDVYLRAGYSSLFAYCRGVLALSDHEAFNRIEAARTARRFPVVLDLLAAGEVNLTAVRLLGPHLTAENHVGVLESARGKRKAEVEEIVARLSPRADVPASVRKLPDPKPVGLVVGVREPAAEITSMTPAADPAGAASPASGEAGSTAARADAIAGATSPLANAGPSVVATRDPRATPGLPPVATTGPQVETAGAPGGSECLLPSYPRRSAEVRPLSPDRYRYQLTIGGSTLEKLRLAKDMLRHALPSGDDEAVLDRALTALLTDLARKKFGAIQKTASSGKATARGVGTQDSRHIPARVRRAVWVRDLGRCTFVGTDGRRCGERAFVEFHHVRPYAVGGKAAVDNIHLRCRRHNGLEARVFFAREPVEEGLVARGRAEASTSSAGLAGRRHVVPRPGAMPRSFRKVVPERVRAMTTSRKERDRAGVIASPFPKEADWIG